MNVTTYAAEDPGGWDAMVARTRALDAAGVDRFVIPDHVVFGERMEEYARPEIGGQAGGRQPTGPDGHWLEPLTTLAFLAGQTNRIRLGTGILIAALRRPVVLAKTVATLDVLSGGRLDLGVGVGWQREEYEAAGLAFDGRGALLDHSLAVCQTLWRERRASFASPDLAFDAIHMMPKPVAPDGLTVWISGTVHPRIARRIARFGGGWIPWGAAAVDTVAGIAQMRALLDEIGHDHSRLQVTANLPTVKGADGEPDLPATMAAVPALVAGGVTDVRTRLAIPADASAALDTASGIVAAFRAATA
jgi:probable F420-dependent oxidoreductase